MGKVVLCFAALSNTKLLNDGDFPRAEAAFIKLNLYVCGFYRFLFAFVRLVYNTKNLGRYLALTNGNLSLRIQPSTIKVCYICGVVLGSWFLVIMALKNTIYHKTFLESP